MVGIGKEGSLEGKREVTWYVLHNPLHVGQVKIKTYFTVKKFTHFKTRSHFDIKNKKYTENFVEDEKYIFSLNNIDVRYLEVKTNTYFNKFCLTILKKLFS